jgi:hypothetical protein
VAPDDVRFRAANREVRQGDTWVLEETVRTADGRAALRGHAAAARAQASRPQQDGLTDFERALGLRWVAAVRTPGTRVVASTEQGEAMTTALSCDIAADLVRRTFRSEAQLPRGFTVYLLAGDDEARGFAARHPSFDDAARKRLERLSGMWVPGRKDLLEYASTSARRIDGAVRQSTNHLLNQMFSARDHAWVQEGLGIYLSHMVTGTRLTFFVKESRYGHDTQRGERSLSDTSDWLHEARVRLDDTPVDLDLLLFRELNVMTRLDALYANALAAYLLETRPQAAHDLFLRLGAGTSVPQAVEQALDTDVRGLEHRFVRWLRETGRPGPR